MKELLQSYIYSSINKIDYIILDSIKIDDYISKMKSNKENITLSDI